VQVDAFGDCCFVRDLLFGRLLLGLEVKDELDDEVAELVIDQLLDTDLSSCDDLKALISVCKKDALLDDLAPVLVPGYLLEMLKHWCEDHLITGL